jgi:ubiquinone biosynthesis protein Coq4
VVTRDDRVARGIATRMTLGEARAAYFERNGFSAAAYEERWVHLRLFGIPLAFPNVASRRRAIPLHDLHHVVTGYDTDPHGEAEIAAWEIAATLPDRGLDLWAAWLLNAAMFALGLVFAPRRVFRAFARGRHTSSLYRVGWSEALLARDVGDVRRELGLDDAARTTWRDRLAFAVVIACLATPPALCSAALWLALR